MEEMKAKIWLFHIVGGGVTQTDKESELTVKQIFIKTFLQSLLTSYSLCLSKGFSLF